MTKKPRKRETGDALENNSRVLILVLTNTNNLIPHVIYIFIRTVRVRVRVRETHG